MKKSLRSILAFLLAITTIFALAACGNSAAPAAGSYYKIIAHKIVSGETTESIAAGLGQDHAKILGLMKTLNGRDNLEMIYAGATLYVPVACKA